MDILHPRAVLGFHFYYFKVDWNVVIKFIQMFLLTMVQPLVLSMNRVAQYFQTLIFIKLFQFLRHCFFTARQIEH